MFCVVESIKGILEEKSKYKTELFRKKVKQKDEMTIAWRDDEVGVEYNIHGKLLIS